MSSPHSVPRVYPFALVDSAGDSGVVARGAGKEHGDLARFSRGQWRYNVSNRDRRLQRAEGGGNGHVWQQQVGGKVNGDGRAALGHTCGARGTRGLDDPLVIGHIILHDGARELGKSALARIDHHGGIAVLLLGPEAVVGEDQATQLILVRRRLENKVAPGEEKVVGNDCALGVAHNEWAKVEVAVDDLGGGVGMLANRGDV